MNPRFALLLCLSATVGCSQANRPVEPHEAAPAAPRASERVQRAPEPTSRTDQPHAATATEPADSHQPPAAPPSAATEPPAPAEPVAVEHPSEPDRPADELPPYLRLIDRIDPAAEGTLAPQLRGPRTVELTTSNVRRFRITRHLLPMRASGSLVLRVDGQVFEWTSRRPIVEFVFDRSSGWTVVDSGDPVP